MKAFVTFREIQINTESGPRTVEIDETTGDILLERMSGGVSRWRRHEGFAITLTKESVIDKASGVIRNVKINGNRSENLRWYSDPVLEEATPLYEGAKVYSNHNEPGDFWGWEPRRRESIMGNLQNVRFSPGGHHADFHVMPSHRGMMDDVQFAPGLQGFSHAIDCEVSDEPRDDGMEVITKINKVESVDLVANPATTRGMFEGQNRILTNLNRENNKEAPVAEPKVESASEKLAQVWEQKATEANDKLKSVEQNLTAEMAKTKAHEATIADLQGKLKTEKDAREKLEGEVKAAKVEAALVGLPEAAAKSLRESAKHLPLDLAISTIESVKASTAITESTPPAPRSEERAKKPVKGADKTEGVKMPSSKEMKEALVA